MSADAIIEIPGRFNGPPGSANGGFVAGRLAAFLDGVTEVTLHAPPPLETPLTVEPTENGYTARAGDLLIATACPGAPLAPAREAPSFASARSAHQNFPPLEDHVFPACFVCGPAREEGDGLRIFAGNADRFDGVADLWTPPEEFASPEGLVWPEILWAALDCPGAFAVGSCDNPMVLGRITGQILERPTPGQSLIVAGWSMFDEGRKHGAGTGLYTEDGKLLAQTEQLWIELKTPAPAA